MKTKTILVDVNFKLRHSSYSRKRKRTLYCSVSQLFVVNARHNHLQSRDVPVAHEKFINYKVNSSLCRYQSKLQFFPAHVFTGH